MRFIVNSESPTATINLPKETPTGGEWTTIKLTKSFYNSYEAHTNRALMINIDEVENDGYFTTSGGLVIKYMASYLIAHHATIDEFRYQATENKPHS